MRLIYERFGKWKWVTVFSVMLAVAYWLINGSIIGLGKMREITGGVSILDVEMYYSAEKAYKILAAQGEAGRILYRHLLIQQDFVFPWIYVMFFISALSCIYCPVVKSNKVKSLLIWIPVTAGMCDYSENFLVLKMLWLYPEKLMGVASVCSIVSTVKWVLVAVSTVLVILGISNFAVKRLVWVSKLLSRTFRRNI